MSLSERAQSEVFTLSCELRMETFVKALYNSKDPLIEKYVIWARRTLQSDLFHVQ